MEHDTTARPIRKRYTTGRNQQLNLKVTIEALRDFYAIADEQNKTLGETFGMAVEALKASMSKK